MTFSIQAKNVAPLYSWINSLESCCVGRTPTLMKEDLDILSHQTFLTKHVASRAFDAFIDRWMGILLRQEISLRPLFSAKEHCIPGTSSVSWNRVPFRTSRLPTSRPMTTDQIYVDPQFRDPPQ